jgi:hypothetical protein
MIDPYQGDPRLFLDENGSELEFKNGQPVVDQGLENSALISLFTAPGWAGNIFLAASQKIGSEFEELASGTITLQSLIDTEKAALSALDDEAYGEVSVEVVNSNSYRLNTKIRISPPGRDVDTLLVQKNGLNWIAQKIDPAEGRR